MIAAVAFRRGRGRPLGSKDRHGRAQRVNRRLCGSTSWRTLCVAFGQRLRSLREEHDIASGELAAAIGAHKMTVAAWERGRSIPSVASMVMIAAALRVSVVDLFPHEAHLPLEAA